jgi:hypothetical protein
MLATTVAVHSTVNVRWRNGAQADAAEGEVGRAVLLIAGSACRRSESFRWFDARRDDLAWVVCRDSGRHSVRNDRS